MNVLADNFRRQSRTLNASEYATSFFASFKIKTDTDNIGRYLRLRTNDEYARSSVTSFSMKNRWTHLRATYKDKLKPWLRASEYATSSFANFGMKTDTDNMDR